MKKQFKLLLFLSVMIIISLSSCEKKNNKKGSGTVNDEKLYNSPYSDLSPEDNKNAVEQTGVDMVDQMTELEGSNAFKVLIQMGTLMNGTNSSAMKTLPIFVSPSLKSTKSASPIFNSLKLTSEDPVSILDEWDNIAGTYVYNFETGEFDFTESVNLVIKFPGKDGETTNTAELTVTKPTVIEIANPSDNWPSDLAPEAPTKCDATLKYKGAVDASWSFSASYKTDGMPTEVTSSLSIEDFKFTASVTHDPYKKASMLYNLKRGSKIIAEFYCEAAGDWSQENIDNNTTTTYDTNYVWEYDYDLGEWVETNQIESIYSNDEVQTEKIITDANAHTILMNIEVVGKVDFEHLGARLRSVEDGQDLMTQQAYSDSVVNILNKNVQLVVVYTDSGKKLAEAEAYTSYDESNDEYSPSLRFVYADQSKEDVLDFASGQYNDFYDALNSFIDQLNSDYDLTLGHIYPPSTK